MNDIKFSLWAAGWLFILLLAGSCKSANESRAPVALTWEMGSYDGNGKYYENSFVLKNVSDAPIGKDWEIYYSQFPRSIRQDASSPVRVEEVNATLFKIYPGEGFLSLFLYHWWCDLPYHHASAPADHLSSYGYQSLQCPLSSESRYR